MSERLEWVTRYMKAKTELDRAKTHFDIVKDEGKEFGTWNEDGVYADLSVVSRESISIKDLEKYNPKLVEELRELNIIKKSESERLTVKVRESNERI